MGFLPTNRPLPSVLFCLMVCSVLFNYSFLFIYPRRLRRARFAHSPTPSQTLYGCTMRWTGHTHTLLAQRSLLRVVAIPRLTRAQLRSHYGQTMMPGCLLTTCTQGEVILQGFKGQGIHVFCFFCEELSVDMLQQAGSQSVWGLENAFIESETDGLLGGAWEIKPRVLLSLGSSGVI